MHVLKTTTLCRLTDPFTILEPRHPPIDVSEQHKLCQWTGLWALIFWISRSGLQRANSFLSVDWGLLYSNNKRKKEGNNYYEYTNSSNNNSNTRNTRNAPTSLPLTHQSLHYLPYLTEHFAILEPRNRSTDEFCVVKKCQSTDFYVLKQWNVRSGTSLSEENVSLSDMYVMLVDRRECVNPGETFWHFREPKNPSGSLFKNNNKWWVGFQVSCNVWSGYCFLILDL